MTETGAAARYSVPEQADSLFRAGVLGNPLIAKNLPAGAVEASKSIRFEGSDEPSLPVNWRFAESIAALKAYEATVVNVLLQRKYGVERPAEVVINTYVANTLSGMICQSSKYGTVTILSCSSCRRSYGFWIRTVSAFQCLCVPILAVVSPGPSVFSLLFQKLRLFPLGISC